MGLVLVIVAVLAVVLASRSNERTQAVGNQAASKFEQERQAAIEAAKTAYAKAKTEGKDLNDGPCLGVVAPNWVADVAHEPRQQVDNLRENQCEQFINREVEHFVELSPQGVIIRAL